MVTYSFAQSTNIDFVLLESVFSEERILVSFVTPRELWAASEAGVMEEQMKARVKMVLLVHILTDAFVLQRPSHESHSLKREQRYSSARKGLCEPVRNRKTK